MERQLEELRAKMEKSSEALTKFERELNVINPEEKTSILTARLMELNKNYTEAQTNRVGKEAAYRSVESGSMAAALTSPQGEALKKLTEDLGEAQKHFADVKVTFGAKHPEYPKAQARVVEMERQLDQARASVARRAEVEFKERRIGRRCWSRRWGKRRKSSTIEFAVLRISDAQARSGQRQNICMRNWSGALKRRGSTRASRTTRFAWRIWRGRD